MAYRKIHDNFWTDPDVEELTPEQKYFYLYLITNPSVNQIGLYEFSIKRACFETGYNTDTVSKLLDFFESAGKIRRSSSTKEILIIKFYYHNKSNSPKVITHVEGLLKAVKDRSLIQYIYSMGIASQEEEEEVQEKKEIQEERNAPKTKKLLVSNTDYIAPTMDQILTYAGVHCIPEKTAHEFFWHYDSLGWENNYGRPIKNWNSLLNKWNSKQPQFEGKKSNNSHHGKPDKQRIQDQLSKLNYDK